MAIDDFMNTMDALSQNEDLKILTDFIEQIMALDDSKLNEQTVEMITGSINGAFTPALKNSAIEGTIKEFEEQGLTRTAAQGTLNTFRDELNSLIEDLKPSKYKKQILENIFGLFISIIEEAVMQYHNYAIDLPIYLDEGAQMPTYAHESDACADVYAFEDQVIPAHSLSNKIRTGLHFAIPEGWEIGLLPRSSIGSKTGLRLSNSRAVIDQQFRDEMMIIYDNNSDSDYTIKAGDRIAQMFVQPTYRFKGIQVSKADFDAIEGNRGGGIGSTGR